MLAPSYWGTPYVTFGNLSEERVMWLFGTRPPDVSLVPGQLIPDGLLRKLKALATPTQVRILQYLAQEPLAPDELARRLRLRAPTVTHHLQMLRLTGLVRLTIRMDTGRETKQYAARREAVGAAYSALEDFLNTGQ